MSDLTDTQLRDAAILASQGDTPEAIARHLLVEVDDLPASLRRKAKRKPAPDPDPDPAPDPDPDPEND